MRNQFTALAKRALAFTLALLLLLTLIPAVPMTAEAAYTEDGWEYFGSYSWLEGRFHSDDADLNFVDDQPYDWKVTIYQARTTANVTVSATVKDASGTVVASVSNKAVTAEKGQDSVMLSASDLSGLTTSMFGTFTLTCTVKAGSSKAAELTKTFKRTVSNPISATVTSRSNPDNVFTFADPIDLVLNIKKLDGVAVAYNAAVTVTKGNTELLAARGISLPASTNTTLSVKDLVSLPTIKTAGTYKVNLTLTNASGNVQYKSSTEFSVVPLENNVTASIESASGSFTFNNVAPNLVVNLTKTDGVAEALITAVTVKDSTNAIVFSDTFETNSANATVTPDLSGLASNGNFTMTATITDDAGNFRGSATATFTCTDATPMKCTLTSNNADNTGNIYATSDDFDYTLSIEHKPSSGQTVSVKVTGTLNGEPYESSTKKATPYGIYGKATVKINGSVLGAYGIFENVFVEVYNASGDLMWKSTTPLSFARVLDTSTPGDLPLLNLNDHFTTKKGDHETKVTLMSLTGANMWRASVPWVTTEKTKGNYAMVDDVQTVMNKTKKTGMQALILLAYGNDDIYGKPNPTDSTWLNAYANYCYYVASYMAQNYPNQVVAFEIWNEWNHSSMSKVEEQYRTGAHYATVVKAASAKIRQVNKEYGTNFKVIAGATAGDGYDNTNTNTFINAMLSASGFVDAVDGISFHTYSSKETTSTMDKIKGQRVFEFISPAKHDFAARFKNFQSMLNKYGAGDKEIWLTETGWTTNSEVEYQPAEYSSDKKPHYTYGVTEQEQAAYLVQLYTWALYDGTVDRIFWYDFMNDISSYTNAWSTDMTESNYGLIHNWNNGDGEPLAYSAKPSYVTACALSSKLAGATNGEQLSLGNNIYAYRFSKDGKYITVMWAEGSNKTVNLTLSENITVSDMYGNATTYKAGSVTLTLTEAPIYLEYASGAVSFG